MKFKNPTTKKYEDFQPLEAGQVRMYVCGPTVYDLLHLGNGRTFLFWDVARRYLQWRGFSVTYVQNFTDVDDKIINRAKAEGVAPEAIAQRYTEAYFEDMDALGVRRADQHPTATGNIQQMIGHIEGLIAKGLAYATDSGVYFEVSKYSEYQCQITDPLENEVGDKRHPRDFALWKFVKPGEPSWESPWGPGRPGWHIECSAMIHSCLGEQVDIHGGGRDLQFPHHVNERAQSEGLYGKQLASHWLHTGMLNTSDGKMGKSSSTKPVLIREALKMHNPEALRAALLLRVHYQHDMIYSDEAVLEMDKFLTKTSIRYSATNNNLEPFYSQMDRNFNFGAGLGHLIKTNREIGYTNKAREEIIQFFSEVFGITIK